MAQKRASDDVLPPLIGPPLPAPGRRSPRTWRLGLLTTLVLVLLLVVSGSLQQLATEYARSLVQDRVAGETADDQRTGSTATNRTETLTYDWRSRLKTFTAGGNTVTYTYTGTDVRATRTLNATAATPFLWDTQAGLPELVDDGTTIYLQAGGDVQREEKLGRIAR